MDNEINTYNEYEVDGVRYSVSSFFNPDGSTVEDILKKMLVEKNRIEIINKK